MNADRCLSVLIVGRLGRFIVGRLGTTRKGVELRGSGIVDVSICFDHFRSLSRDPFADIRRATSEYSSVKLQLSKEFHSVPVDQIDIPEIDGNRTCFGFYYAAKCAHILFGNPTADAQRHDVAAGNSVDSAAHPEIADEAFSLLLICVFVAITLARPPYFKQALNHL
jgi:hypothetical protein